jgi:small subunit ribosomal protein S6
MRIYEELFIIDPNATEEQQDSVVAQIEEVIKQTGGVVNKTERWGRRKLAYRVRKQEEGLYVLMEFSADASAVKEVERRLRVHEMCLKYLTVRIDEKLKWLEKRKRAREARAAKRPQPTRAPLPEAPEPETVRPGTPAESEE